MVGSCPSTEVHEVPIGAETEQGEGAMSEGMEGADQTTLPGVSVPDGDSGVPRRRTRTIHFECSVRGEKQIVHVSIFDGMVGFRPHRSRKQYVLDIDTWVGLGFWHAAQLEAKAVLEVRRQKRRGGV